MPKFIATHGVQLGTPAWASFVRDEELDTPEGERRYSAVVEDPADVKRLRAIKDYGISEVK